MMMASFAVILFGCKSNDYPRHTDAFYINDYAGAFMEATRYSILLEGESLYDLTKDLPEGGAQIVVATFMVESTSEIENYDKTEIFRAWKIGKNDMGVLILIFFEKTIENEIVYPEFLELQIEVGYRMEQYLTPTRLGLMTDQTVFNPEYHGDMDLGVMHLIYEMLSVIYVDAYGYESFNYDMEYYEDYMMSYVPEYYISQEPLTFWLYLLSPFFLSGNLTSLIPIIVFIIVGGGFGFVVKNKGGGGSSGGMGIFRRRR
jgi:hypothetical protein